MNGSLVTQRRDRAHGEARPVLAARCPSGHRGSDAGCSRSQGLRSVHRVHSLNRAKRYPIGSEVTEAACKTLVKQRLCQSGTRWMEKGASMVISLRSLVLTKERRAQFWNKIDRYGFPVAA